MQQTNSRPSRIMPARETSNQPVPAVLLAGALVDETLRETLERVCAGLQARLLSFDECRRSGVPEGFRPCLVVALLPQGERRVPGDVVEAVTAHVPGLPILLLCQEQLVRPSIAVEDGRIILIGQPFTDEKLSAHLRSVVDALPPLPAKPRVDAAPKRSGVRPVRPQPAPQKSSSGLSGALAIGALALLLGSGAYFFFSPKVEPERKPEAAGNAEKADKPDEKPTASTERKDDKAGAHMPENSGKAPAVAAPVPSPPPPPKKAEPPPVLSVDTGAGEALELRLIPAGTFQYGSAAGEAERGDDEFAVRTETIAQPFYLSKFEITQGHYAAVMGINPSQIKNPKHPADTVSFYDAKEFCVKLKARTGKVVRLPTEIEWEYACRAGTATRFSYGDTLTDDMANVDLQANAGNRREAVIAGSYAPNAFGLFDMHGNVWEWCVASEDETAAQVLRGGSWAFTARNARSAARHLYQPGGKNPDFGFRVLIEVPDSEKRP